MKSKLYLTIQAKDEIQQIALAVAKLTSSKEAARKLVEGLRKEYSVLEDFPESGSFPADYMLRSKGYRFLVYKDYLIFYKYEKSKNEVSIISVMNAKLDYVRVMKKFL